MAPRNPEKLAKKNAYFEKLIDLCINFPNALIVSFNNVGSKQIQDIRMELRGKAEVLGGKNTMIRTAIRNKHATDPDLNLDRILAAVNGNIGFIFAKTATLEDIREVLKKYRLPAFAKAGVPAPADVIIPAGPTGLDPSQTTMFQTLNVATKIVKGQIEIVSDVKACIKGEKVTTTAQTLLSKLAIKPFEYGMEVEYVYQDGCVFAAEVLDITDDVLIAKFMAGIANVAAFGREIGIPTEAGLAHMFANAFKNVAALCADIDIEFKQIEEVKKFLADPDAYKAANPGGGGGGGGGGGAAAAAPAAAAAKAPEPEEEEEDMDFDLFR
jgi:large subunit ribosomal protein LP0